MTAPSPKEPILPRAKKDAHTPAKRMREIGKETSGILIKTGSSSIETVSMDDGCSVVMSMSWEGFELMYVIRSIEAVGDVTALTLYASRTGRFPEPREGLQPLVVLGLIDRLPVDAWSNPFHDDLVGGPADLSSSRSGTAR